MLPSAVLPQVNGVHLAAFGPEPVSIGKWSQPASVTAVQQDRPSLTTLLPATRSRLASRSISFLRKPLTTVSRSRLGLRSAVVSTAATNGVLPAAPRPRLPPAGLCPRPPPPPRRRMASCRPPRARASPPYAARRDRRRPSPPGPRAWASLPRVLPSPPSACA